MERVCRPRDWPLPGAREIEFFVSCPDWATMCKHVAAVCYGVGARLDEQPELLFRLREVDDEKDLIVKASKGLPLTKQAPAKDRVLTGDGLSELFGLEMGEEAGERLARPRRPALAAPSPKKDSKKKQKKPVRRKS